jgi:DNA-binding NtrC family response regulator
VVDIGCTSEHDEDAAAAKSLPPLRVLLGTSAASQELLRNLVVIAATDLSVLVQGEAGTGKELVARWLHNLSPYSRGRFIRVTNWAAQPAGGGPGGGETEDRVSLADRLAYAKVATIYVENVENLSLRSQASLARVLQEESNFGNPGDLNSAPVGFRIISATQKDLKREVAQGTVRPEFFHSISAFTARIPPLRTRLNDLPEIISHFLEVHGQDLGLAPQPLSGQTLRVLQQYPWPGNLRELEQMLIGYVLTGNEALLVEKVTVLQRSTAAPADGPQERLPRPLAEAHRAGSQQLDDETIIRALRENGWNRRQTARRLEISYRSLLYKLKKIDLASGHSPYRVASSPR